MTVARRFTRKSRSARERDLLERAKRALPAGPRNPAMSPEYAMVIKEARGSRIVDMSDNEYIDYLLGSGPMLLGHAHPAVVRAVRERLERGTSYLLVNEPAIELAEELVRAVPCAERVSFCNTGTEAIHYALRLARAHRRRDRILKFEGGYHGQSDYALMSNQWTRDPPEPPTPKPNSLGIPASAQGEVLVAPFNDLETTTALIERYGDELAAVLVEPMQRTIPPKAGFLEGLREVTARREVPLVFDEVVTGFRLSYGSAQAYYGVTPDLCALGKSISAGHPIGVVCGRAEILSHAEAIRQVTGGYVSITGTYSGNPISCAAALACLDELRKEGVYEGLFAKGRRLWSALERSLEDAGVPARITGEPPAFQVWFTDRDVVDFRSMLGADAGLGARFTALLLDHGIMKAHEKFFVSTVHSDDDLAETIEAFGLVAESLAVSLGRG